MQQDTSKDAYTELRESGHADTLRNKVLNAFLTEGPMHNLRLLEHLQQKEKQRPFVLRLDLNRGNIWPRVTELVGSGVLVDLGAHRGRWNKKKKTMHFWGVRAELNLIPPGWEHVEKKPKLNFTPGVQTGATQGAFGFG